VLKGRSIEPLSVLGIVGQQGRAPASRVCSLNSVPYCLIRCPPNPLLRLPRCTHWRTQVQDTVWARSHAYYITRAKKSRVRNQLFSTPRSPIVGQCP
jgi:hypothetical protein